MAFAHSPKIVTDGMVFYYDTGNSKSYAGEPTTNLVTNPTFLGTSGTQTSAITDNWYFSGYSGTTGFNFYDKTFSPIPLKFPNEGAVITTGPNGSVNRRIYYNGTVEPSTTYILSYWLYSSSYGSISNYFFTYRADGTGTTSPSYGQSVSTGEWVFVQQSFTTPADTGNAQSVNWGPVISAGTDSLFAMQRFQVEAKPHATQFVDGTRSATEALKDFTKNATLDLSNVSFDSNAQMTFDGTDDQIVLTSPTLPSSGGSIEIVVSREGSTPNSFIYAKVGDSTNRYYLRQPSSDTFDAVRGNPLSSASFGVLDLGTYYHLVMVWDATTIYAYKNGELQNTSTYTNPGTDAVGGQLGNGPGENNAIRLPLTKFYNRALSAEEVQQNFNTIKGRFGI